ncbi:MAG: glycoside hydrolase, partial [Myxococcales bacterium]
AGVDHHRRTLVMPGLADPDVLAIHDDLFVLTGTSTTVSLPFFASTDLVTFTPLATYDPSALDPAHSYCDVWAPDLARQGDTFHLYFSARRVAKGAACTGQDVTTFHATAPDQAMNFGAPELFDSGGGPASRLTPGCAAAGCERTVRIDAALVGPPDDRWFFYVWFDQGNNVSSFRLGAPGGVVSNAGPARFALPAVEEGINEGPDVFAREGRQYLFFSSAWYNSQYAMSYVMGDSIGDLTRQRAVRRHSRAERAGDGRLVQSHGHNSVVARRGEFFNVFHQGAFDGAGKMTGRSTFKQRLAFRPDGSLHTLNLVDVRWSQLPGHVYSLDAVRHDGTVVGPCIGAPVIGDATAVTFNGVCPSAGDLLLDKGEVAAWRLYTSNDGTWSNHVDLPYDGVSDDVFFDLPGGSLRAVSLRWNEKATHTEYSIDVRRADGTWVAPCVADVVLGTRIGHVFDGSCPSAKTSVAPGEVTEFRVCSAVNNDWAHATCGSAPSDGHRGQIDVLIP